MNEMHEKIVDLEEENEQLIGRRVQLAQTIKMMKSELTIREDVCDSLKRTNRDLKRTISV